MERVGTERESLGLAARSILDVGGVGKVKRKSGGGGAGNERLLNLTDEGKSSPHSRESGDYFEK